MRKCKTNKCLREQLRYFEKDERMASAEYKEMARNTKWKRTFRAMSKDEMKHHGNIKRMLCDQSGGKWKRGRCVGRK